jgi:hypothetical protein
MSQAASDINYPLIIDLTTTNGGNITLTPEQFMATREAIFHMCMNFGYIAAIAGFLVGIYVGWSWCKYYQKKQEMNTNEE